MAHIGVKCKSATRPSEIEQCYGVQPITCWSVMHWASTLHWYEVPRTHFKGSVCPYRICAEGTSYHEELRPSASQTAGDGLNTIALLDLLMVVLQICTLPPMCAMLLTPSEGERHGTHSRALSPLSQRPGHQSGKTKAGQQRYKMPKRGLSSLELSA